MSDFIKSYSNYILKKQHQLVNDGKIYERDWVTIRGTDKFTAGQIPIYAESNFKITVRGGLFGRKKHNFGDWIENCEKTSDEWTMDTLSSCNYDVDDDGRVELNQKSDNLIDFAYYGSCTELIRASVEDIIRKFPAELYFGNRKQEYVKTNNTFAYLNGWIVENPFGIDLYSESINEDDVENVLRYFCASYMDYVVIVNGVKKNITSFKTVKAENVNLSCLVDGQILKYITIGYEGGSISLTLNYCNGKRVLIYDNSGYYDIHIRPNDEEIEYFFTKQLDGVEKLLLNRNSNPVYKNIFQTPIETDKGITFVRRPYTWPIVNGWNLDIEGFPYVSYIQSLTKLSNLLDEYYSDNLYRSMTHEAIKNFDWSYTREYQDGDEYDYVVGGTKIVNLIRLYGRGLDDIKRYIDGITFTNIVTYNDYNNVPDDFLPTKLSTDGWVITDVSNGNNNIITDPLYPTELYGYSFEDASKAFLKNLFINSKYILRAKGTKRSIEMIMALFGINHDWYDLKEYVHVGTPSSKDYRLPNDDNADESNVYFQSKGGWGKHNNNGRIEYRETINYTNVVENVSELTTLPYQSVDAGDIYYVSDATGYASNYFKLNSKDGLRTIGGNGWENKSSSDPEVQYVKSIVDNTKGNNPHVGFGMYDGGTEYVNYASGFFNGLTQYEDNKKCWYKNNANRTYNAKYRQTSYSAQSSSDTLNVKRFVIKNKSGNQEFATYFVKHILPYIEQVLPATVLYELEGFDNGFNGTDDYITLSKHEVYLNDNKDTETVVLTASDNWSQNNQSDVADLSPSKGSETNGTVITIKKKSNGGTSQVKYSLDKNHNISTYLIIRTCSIEITPKHWDIPSTGGTMTFYVKVDGHDASDGEYTYVCTNNDLIITKSQNKLYVRANANFSGDINGLIRVIHSYDSSCTDEATFSQGVSELSITATPPTYNFSQDGGSFTFDVVAVGGGEDYIYSIESNSWISSVKKNGNHFTVNALPNSSNTDSTPVTITFKHIDNNSITATVTVTQTADKDLSIDINPKILEFNSDATYTTNKAVLTVLGGSKAYIMDKSYPSWIKISLNGYNVTVNVDKYNGLEERSYDVTFYHADDNSVQTTLTIVQKTSGDLSITADPSEYKFPYYSSSKSFTIKVCGGSKNFTYVSDGDWFTISKTTGEESDGCKEYTLNVTAQENKDKENERTGKITVYHSDNNQILAEINLTQEPQEPFAINVEDESGASVSSIDEVECEGYFSGDKYRLKVVMNPSGSDFTVTSTPSWVTYNKVKNTGGFYYLYLYFEANTSTIERSGNIVLTHTTDPSVVKKITVTQAICEAIDLLINDKKSETWNVESSGGEQTFTMTVKGGTKQYVIPETETWLSITPKGVTGEEQITVKVEEQPEISLGERSTTLVFYHKDDDSVFVTLIITQGEKLSITKDPDEDMLHVSSAGQTKNYNIIPRGGSAQSVLVSNTCGDWVTIIKNNNQVSIQVRKNTESEERECNVCFAHADDNSLQTCIKITQDGFNPSVNIETEKPKILEVCSYKSKETCDNYNDDCTECLTYCEKEESSQYVNRSFEFTYDVTVVGGSGKWEVKGFSDATCCESDDVECSNNLVDIDWATASNVGEQLIVEIDENRELCSKNDDDCTDVGKGKKREACLIIKHKDTDDVIDKLKISQKEAIVKFRNFEIKNDPEAIRIPARCEDKVEGEGMTAKYYCLKDVLVTSTKEKFINCTYEKTLYVPWNATTDCTDSIENEPCTLMVNGNEVKGKLTKIKYNTFSYSGGSGNVPIYSNEAWTAQVTSGNDWISLGTSNGGGNTTSNVTFTISKNETCTSRVGSIKIKSCLNDDLNEYKEINIEINQERGHNCVLNVWKIHPIPEKIPEEGGIYKYRVASYDCTDPVPWEVEATNCTVNCVAGYEGGTESVGVTVKVEKAEEGAKTVSLKFKQKGNTDCDLQSSDESGSQDPVTPPTPTGDTGDCSCDCTILVHTNENNNSFSSSGGTITIYVWQSCNDCKPVSWKASSDCSWAKITQGSTGNGVCCDTYDCNGPTSGQTEQSCLAGANICKVEVEKNTGEQRSCNITFTQTGEGCSKTTVVGITQLKNGETPTGCTDCYVAFQNSRTVNMESSGGTLNNEGIVQHGNGTNCDVEVKNFTITSSDGNTSGISVSPSSGDITSCNITVPANETEEDRTIVITIHPNIDEKSTANCKTVNSLTLLSDTMVLDENGDIYSDYSDNLDSYELLPTYSSNSNGKVVINGEVYADYTDNKYILTKNNEGVVVYSESGVDRVKYTPDQTYVTDTDEYNDATNSIEPEKVNLVLGENKDPVERSCKVIFTQKEADENGTYQKSELVIWQDPAVIDYRDYQFFACPTTYTVGADGGNVVIDVLSTANKYINDIKREENVPIGYTCDCEGECVGDCGENDYADGNTGTDGEINPPKPPEPEPDPDPDPDPDEGEESDPDWAGKCKGTGYDGGGTKIGVINGETECVDGGTFIRLTCDPPLKQGETVEVTLSICDKIDGGVANKSKATITYDTDGELFLGYKMDHCNYWWPYIGIDTPGWYRGTLRSDGDVMTPTGRKKTTLLETVARDGEGWASINCSNNVITVQPNDDYVNDRITSFTLIQNDSKNVQTVTVFQKRKEKTFSYNLFTEPLSLHFKLSGGTEYLEVQSHIIESLNNVEQGKKNLGYTVVGTKSWCTIDPSTNVVTCEPNNDGLESRSMTFVFTQDKSGLNHTVLVEQGEQLKYVFEIDPNAITFEAAGGSQSFKVTSQIISIVDEEEGEPIDMEYEILGGTEWCTISEDGTITCTENTDKENARVTKITLVQEKTGLINSVLVFQKKPDILPELYEYIDAADANLQTQIDELKGGASDTDEAIDNITNELENITNDLQQQINDLENKLPNGISFGSGHDLDNVRFKVENGIIVALYNDDEEQIMP